MGIVADDLHFSIPKYEVGVVDAVANDGPDLVQHVVDDRRDKLRRAKTETIRPSTISCFTTA